MHAPKRTVSYARTSVRIVKKRDVANASPAVRTTSAKIRYAKRPNVFTVSLNYMNAAHASNAAHAKNAKIIRAHVRAEDAEAIRTYVAYAPENRATLERILRNAA